MAAVKRMREASPWMCRVMDDFTFITDGFVHREVDMLWRTCSWCATIIIIWLTACVARRPKPQASSSVHQADGVKRREACENTPVNACPGPLILYEVPGPWGDIIVRRLAECERCRSIFVIADTMPANHPNAALITDGRRQRQD